MRYICSNYGCTQFFFFLIKSNLYYTRFIKFVVVSKRGSEGRGPIPRLSAWATQLQRNVVAVASRWLHCVRLDRPGKLSPKPSASIAKSFNTTL